MITDQDTRQIGQQLAETALRLAADIDILTAENTLSLDEWNIEGHAWRGASVEGWQESIGRRTAPRHISWSPQIAAWLRAIPDMIREIEQLPVGYKELPYSDEKEDLLARLCGEIGDPDDITAPNAEIYLRQHLLADADVTVFRTIADSEKIRQGGNSAGVGFYWWHAWRDYVRVMLGLDTSLLTLHAAMDILAATASANA